MSEKKQRTLHMYLGDEYIGPVTPAEVTKDSVWVTDTSKWRTALVVGRTVSEATIDFESGNRAQAVFKFPDAADLSFEEAERLIRKELGAE